MLRIYGWEERFKNHKNIFIQAESKKSFMSYKIVWEDRGVYWKYNDSITGAEVIEGSTSIYGDARFDDLLYKLVDFSDAESVEMTQEEVAIIAFQHKAAEISNRHIKNAIIIKPGCKLASLFASFFKDSKWEVEIFDDIESASKWVDRKV